MPYGARKYGRVTLENQRHIADDEPLFIFRAQDKFLPAVLAYYGAICRANGATPSHLDGVRAAQNEVAAWQEINGSKVPTSAPMEGGE